MSRETGTVTIEQIDKNARTVTFQVAEKAINGQRDPDPRSHTYTEAELLALPAISPDEAAGRKNEEWKSDSYQTFTVFDAIVAWNIHTVMEGIWEGTEITISGPFLVR